MFIKYIKIKYLCGAPNENLKNVVGGIDTSKSPSMFSLDSKNSDSLNDNILHKLQTFYCWKQQYSVQEVMPAEHKAFGLIKPKIKEP